MIVGAKHLALPMMSPVRKHPVTVDARACWPRYRQVAIGWTIVNGITLHQRLFWCRNFSTDKIGWLAMRHSKSEVLSSDFFLEVPFRREDTATVEVSVNDS